MADNIDIIEEKLVERLYDYEQSPPDYIWDALKLSLQSAKENDPDQENE